MSQPASYCQQTWSQEIPIPADRTELCPTLCKTTLHADSIADSNLRDTQGTGKQVASKDQATGRRLDSYRSATEQRRPGAGRALVKPEQVKDIAMKWTAYTVDLTGLSPTIADFCGSMRTASLRATANRALEPFCSPYPSRPQRAHVHSPLPATRPRAR